MTDDATTLPPPLPEPPPLPASALPVKAWRWWLHLLILLPYPLLMALVGSTRSESRGAALTGGWKGLLLVCAVELAIFGTIFAIAVCLSKSTREDLRLRLRQPGLTVLLGVAYSVAMRIAVGIVVIAAGLILIVTNVVPKDELMKYMTNNRPNVEAVVNVEALKNDPAYFWLTLTLVSFVVAGLREELWRSGSLAALRHVAPRAFGSRKGELLAVVVTSLVFGLGHLPQSVMAVGMTALLGLFLGSIMVLHRSTWLAVIAHGMFDATSFAMIPLALETLKHLPK